MSDRASRLWRNADRDLRRITLDDGRSVGVQLNPFLPDAADQIVVDAVSNHFEQLGDPSHAQAAISALRNGGAFTLDSQTEASITQRLEQEGFVPQGLPADQRNTLVETALHSGLSDHYAHRLIDGMRGADGVMSANEATVDALSASRLQIALKTLGYDTGPVTGEYNAQTQAAMATYTADFAIPADQIAALRGEVTARTDVTFDGARARPDLTSVGDAFSRAAQNNGLDYTPAQTEWATEAFRQYFAPMSSTYDTSALPPPPAADAPRDDRTFLMVSPQEYSVMPEKLNAFAHWEFARSQLAAVGNVVVVDGREELGQSREIFARDKAFIIGDVAFTPDNRVASEFRDSEQDNAAYQQEVDQQARVLGRLGLDVVPVEDAWFEGGNVVVDEQTHTVFIGYQASPSPNGQPMPDETRQFLEDSIQRVGDAVKARMGPEWQTMAVPLAQYDPFYHLDTAMSSVLPTGQVIMYPGATTPEAYDAIRNRLGADRIIEIDRDTANQMVTNFEYAGNTLVMTAARDNIGPLAQRLEGLGYTLRTPDEVGLDSGVFQSGGYRCMTLAIDRLPDPSQQQQQQPSAAAPTY
jgi:N-dimethylarginine dimethylaminohydrolase